MTTRAPETIDPDAPLRSFGRRRGRKLSPRQAALLREVLPQVSLSPGDPIAGVLPGPKVWLEIGFGGGEHLIWQAGHNPHVHLIGCEPFEEGVVKVLAAITDNNLRNISVHMDDARQLLANFPSASIDRVFILFPDPWPKRKHQKRRLVNRALLHALSRIMKPGAELRIGTDIPDYARTILMAFATSPEFDWMASRPDHWRVRPPDWPQTRYEQKAEREGRRSCYLLFRRGQAPTESPIAKAVSVTNAP